MRQTLVSFKAELSSGASRRCDTSFSTLACEHVLLYLSLGLLILSTADSGPLGSVTKLCWLVSVVALSFINIGAAFAAYLSSLAIYSPLHFNGWGSIFQRPDNYAMVIVLTAMAVLAFRDKEAWPRFNGYVPAFLTFSILHGVLFSQTSAIAALLRDITVPLLACELLAMIRLRKIELDALQSGMAVLGGYMGLVSILERIPVYAWILPPWVGDTSLRPFDPFLNDWIGLGRSGGTLLQPAFNGLLLSLIFCFLLPRLRRAGFWPILFSISLCVIGAFFTYTRGVWLGLALAFVWFPGWCRSLRQAQFRRAALACIAAVLLVAAHGMASERLQDSGTIYYRFNLWGAALRLTSAHPFLGVGFFNFGTAMTGAEQGFGSLLPNLGRDVEEGVASHNTLLTVLVEFGFVGLLLYVLAFCRIVQRARNSMRQACGRSGAAWVFSFALVYIVNAQVVSAFEGATNAAFFGVLGALAGARTEMSTAETREPE